MRLDVRMLLAAAVTAAALLVPAGSSTGDPPNQFSCPDGFVLAPLGAVFPEKDNNENGQLCLKAANNTITIKDDNSNPHSD